jgi:hypothetical protein
MKKIFFLKIYDDFLLREIFDLSQSISILNQMRKNGL